MSPVQMSFERHAALTAEVAELRRRIEVLQEVVRQQHACWQTSRMPWQSGSPCEIEFAAALRREATP